MSKLIEKYGLKRLQKVYDKYVAKHNDKIMQEITLRYIEGYNKYWNEWGRAKCYFPTMQITDKQKECLDYVEQHATLENAIKQITEYFKTHYLLP